MGEEVSGADGRPVLAWLTARDRFSGLASFLEAFDPDRVWLVGGAVRDFHLGRTVEQVNDVDLLYEGEMADIVRRRAHLLIGRTPFGNPQFALGPTATVDVFPPAAPDGAVLTLRQALAHCDMSTSATAVCWGSAEVVDPHGGVSDIRRRRTTLLAAGWATAPVSMVSGLVDKLIGFHASTGFHVVNLQLAASAVARSVPADSRVARDFAEWCDALASLPPGTSGG